MFACVCESDHGCRQSAYFLIEFVCKAQVQSMVSPINEYTLEDNTVFSIEGKGLKLNTAEDVQPFVDTILQMDDLQEIRMSGNTIGVEAGMALASALQSRKNIKVSPSITSFVFTCESLPFVHAIATDQEQAGTVKKTSNIHRHHASNNALFCISSTDCQPL